MNKKLSLLSVSQYIVMAATTVSIVFPLLFILMGSLKGNDEIFTNPFGLPMNADMSIYSKILIEKGFIYNIFNSLYYSTVAMVISAIICFIAAYAIARMKWKLSGLFMAFLMIGIMVPTNSMILPLYVITRKIGLTDPRIALLGVYIAFSIPRTIFILVGFLKDLPRSLEEAAIIDGCNIWKAMFSVILPVMRPAIATVCIFNFLQVWNDLLLALIFVTKTDQMTIQTGLMKFQGIYATDYTSMLAGVTIIIVPVMLVYFFLQKNIIAGMTSGATKG